MFFVCLNFELSLPLSSVGTIGVFGVSVTIMSPLVVDASVVTTPRVVADTCSDKSEADSFPPI